VTELNKKIAVTINVMIDGEFSGKAIFLVLRRGSMILFCCSQYQKSEAERSSCPCCYPLPFLQSTLFQDNTRPRESVCDVVSMSLFSALSLCLVGSFPPKTPRQTGATTDVT
jgi:hypothetical protein